MAKFNHDFVGREALERSTPETERRKVTLSWNAEDVAKAFETFTQSDGLPAKFIDLPRANYATWQYDAVLNGNGDTVGVAAYSCLSWNERAILSVSIVEPEYATPGTQVTVLWGEPDNGAKSAPWLEPHRQIEIRATVVEGVHR